jgi:hypothetical protein
MLTALVILAAIGVLVLLLILVSLHAINKDVKEWAGALQAALLTVNVSMEALCKIVRDLDIHDLKIGDHDKER